MAYSEETNNIYITKKSSSAKVRTTPLPSEPCNENEVERLLHELTYINMEYTKLANAPEDYSFETTKKNVSILIRLMREVKRA